MIKRCEIKINASDRKIEKTAKIITNILAEFNRFSRPYERRATNNTDMNGLIWYVALSPMGINA
jgi:hypothetical protein